MFSSRSIFSSGLFHSLEINEDAHLEVHLYQLTLLGVKNNKTSMYLLLTISCRRKHRSNNVWCHYKWFLNVFPAFYNNIFFSSDRNFPITILFGIPGVTVLYILMNVAYFTVLNKTQMLASDAVAIVSSSLLGSGRVKVRELYIPLVSLLYISLKVILVTLTRIPCTIESKNDQMIVKWP